MSEVHFISKPNKCDGCPLAEIASLVEKGLHWCAHKDWQVEYRLDDLGHTICKVTRRGTA